MHTSRSIRASLLRFGALWALGAWVVLAGCECGGTVAVERDGGGTCTVHDDCEGGVCLDGVCADHGGTCVNVFDCPLNLECIGGLCLRGSGGTDGGASDGGGGGDGGVSDGGDDGGVQRFPRIGVSPTLLDFGAARMGAAVTMEFVVSSVGELPLQLLEARRETGTTPEFEVTAVDAFGDPLTLPLSLEPGRDIEVKVVYSPTDGLADTGFAVVISNDPASPTTQVELRSEYKGTFDIVVSPEQLDFGFVTPPNTSTQTVTVTNQGAQSSVLTLTEIRTEPVSSQAFTVVPPTPAPVYLFGGDSVDLEVTYAPPAAPLGVHDEAMVIASTDPDEPTFTVPLFGYSVPPAELVVSPTAIDFGDVQLGFPESRTITLQNPGGRSLEIRDFGITLDASGQFSVSGPALPYVINQSGQVELTVGFDPAFNGPQGSSGVSVVHEDPNNASLDVTVNVPVVGRGISPLIIVDPSSIDFGQVYRQSAATPVNLRVRNIGFGDLSITRIGLGTGTTAEFGVGAVALPATLAAGGELLVPIGYTPSAIGADTGVLEVASSDKNNPLVQVSLAGEGSDCAPGTADIDGNPSNGCECFAWPANGDTCVYPGGITGCDGANRCYLAGCNTNRWNNDGDPGNGCEYTCTLTGLEVCDTVDNDCDGLTDPMTANDTSHCGACNNVCQTNNATQQCLGGTCVPTCVGQYGDCDTSRENGCETATNTLTNCGGCGDTCSVVNGSATCATGTCAVSSCSLGWCDADGATTLGCEFDLDTNPSCTTFTNLGSVRGDAGSDVVSGNYYGEQWFRVYVSEGNSSATSCYDLGARITLTPDAGHNYNLYTFCDDCTDSAASSVNGTGQVDQVDVRWDEDCILGFPAGTDSGRNIYIRVTYGSANTCATFNLRVQGNTFAGSNTCPEK